MKKQFVAIIFASLFLTNCTAMGVSRTATPAPTKAPAPTATLTSTATITSTSTITPTLTPVPLSLVFEDDFVSDPLGWTSVSRNPYNQPTVSYGEGGLRFDYKARGDEYNFRRGANILSIDGDFDIEVVIDRRVRLSGLWFSYGSPSLISDNWFLVLIEQGDTLDSWESAEAHLGVYQPSQEHRGYFAAGTNHLAGEIHSYIAEQNGKISLRLNFRGDQMRASVSGSPMLIDTNSKLYSGKKYFMGFIVGSNDHFTVEDVRVWIPRKDDFKIVSLAAYELERAAPTLDALLSMTPTTPTVISVPNSVTATAGPTIDSFVGIWQNVVPDGRGYARITITQDINALVAHFFGLCGQTRELLCDDGSATAPFEGNPFILIKDSQFVVQRIIMAREGSLLHVTTFGHYTDWTAREDYIFETYLRR